MCDTFCHGCDTGRMSWCRPLRPWPSHASHRTPRKSPKGCVPIPDKILEFWPEVPIYPDKNRKILDQVCAKIGIKFCWDGTLCRPPDKITCTKKFRHVHISAVFFRPISFFGRLMSLRQNIISAIMIKVMKGRVSKKDDEEQNGE